MRSKLKKIYQNLGNGHHHKVVAFAVFGAALGAILTVTILYTEDLRTDKLDSDLSSTSSVETLAYAMAKADPVALRIPKIDLDTEFSKPLGLNNDQTVEVPDDYETVGYYKYGPTPGELGPAVVFGHVDSLDGPAVFFSLGQLETGDQVYVDRVDGTTATFTVTKIERHTQSSFPTESVYGQIDHAGLRLITCTGIYDHGVQKYSHNLIVYAELNKDPEDQKDH